MAIVQESTQAMVNALRAPRQSRRGAGAAGLGVIAGVALAVLLSAGAAPPAATPSHAGETADAPNQAEFVVAGLPHRAAKSDRLSRWPRTPQAPVVDSWLKADPLSGPEASEASEDDIVAAPLPGSPSEPARGPGPDAEPASSASPEPSDPRAEQRDADEIMAAATRSAPVTANVNLRAGPDKAAAVITVVPASSLVEVIDCEVWCEVVFAGERGWIYKSFVRGST